MGNQKSKLGTTITSASSARKRRGGPLPRNPTGGGNGNVMYFGGNRVRKGHIVAAAAVGAGLVYASIYGKGIAQDYFDKGCSTEFFTSPETVAEGAPCEVPRTSELVLGTKDGSGIGEVAVLNFSTDTKTNNARSVLKVYVSGEATPNYDFTGLSDDLPASDMNAKSVFATYNLSINSTNTQESASATELCQKEIDGALALVRSNAEWFEHDDFPASVIANAASMRHRSEPGFTAGSLEIAFVSVDPLGNADPTGEKELMCGDGR